MNSNEKDVALSVPGRLGGLSRLTSRRFCDGLTFSLAPGVGFAFCLALGLAFCLAFGLTPLANAAEGKSSPSTAQTTLPRSDAGERLRACVACHADQGKAVRDVYYPRIAGKPAGYLYNQLQHFRDGRRQYPLMTWMTAHLSDEYLREIAEHFATLDVPYPPPQTAALPAATLDKGRQLVLNGDPDRRIPACIACHGQRLTGVAPALPGLVGLPRDYVSAQFGAWRNGTRRAAAPDCMGELAKRLTLEEVSAAASWLAAQPVPADSRPDARLKAPLPLACGSVQESAR